MLFQYITYTLGAVAAYRMWDDMVWLSILVALIAVSYGVHGEEATQHKSTGEYSTGTATRLLLTFIIVLGIFIYSLV